MRMRLILSFALVVLVSIASVLVIVRQGAASEVRTFMTRGGMMGLDSLSVDLEAYYQRFGTWQGVDVLLEASHMRRGMGQGMISGAGGPWMRLADAQGQVVADNRGEPRGRLSQDEQQGAVVLNDARGQVIGYLAVAGTTVASNVASERDLLNRLVRAGWIAAAISGALALLLATLLSYRLLKPVQALTQAAERMSAGDLSQRVPVHGSDELAVLGHSFNQMAGSLGKAEQNRRLMTADIAHELRTPIAIQRAHLEALQDGIYPLTVENLQPVLEQTDLLTRLVNDLRTLALADAGELRLERHPTDLPDLLRRVVERFRPEAINHQVKLALDLPPGPPPPISVDAARVEQVLNNLLSNALRHTPEGGTVQVSLEDADGPDPSGGAFALVRVSDTGSGIPPEALPRLFERFYRADPARSREQGGTGLGLAIARQLALLHGGDLTAANREQGGAEFALRLPLSPQ